MIVVRIGASEEDVQRRWKAHTLTTDNDDQGEHNERHKQDQLQKQKEGKGHWKPELASNSEEAVSVL